MHGVHLYLLLFLSSEFFCYGSGYFFIYMFLNKYNKMAVKLMKKILKTH